MFEAATNRDNRCRPYRGPRPDGGRLNRIVGVIAAQRQRTETEVVFAGIVVTSRIGLRVDEAICEFRKPQPPFGGPVPGHRRTTPYVDHRRAVEKAVGTVAGAVRETAAGGDAAELQIHSVTSDERHAASLNALEHAFEHAGFVRRNGLLLLLTGLLEGVGTALLRVRAARADEDDQKHEADAGSHSPLVD